MHRPDDETEKQSWAGESLRARFQAEGHPHDLAEALRLGWQALAAAQPGTMLGVRAFRLATTLAVQYETTADPGLLDEAGRLFETATSTLHPGHEDYPTAWTNAAIIRLRRFTLTGDPAELDAAIEKARRGLDAYPGDDPRRVSGVNNLAGALRRRYEITRQLADLDEAIMLNRMAVQSDRDTQRGMMLASLAGSLTARFGESSDMCDLAEAISVGLEAERAAPPGDQARASALFILAAAYQLQFEVTGSLESLTQAIERQRDLIGVLPDAHPEASNLYLGLARSLRGRFTLMGVSHDLDEAIPAARRSLELAREDVMRRHAIMEVAMLLPSRAVQRQAEEDPSGAVACCDEALALISPALSTAPARHRDRVDLLTVRGNVHLRRYQLSHDADDAREAVHSYRDALDAGASDSPHAEVILSNLGYALMLANPAPASDELGQAIDALRRAVDGGDPSQPMWAQAAANLAVALIRRYEYSRQEDDRSEAVGLCRRVVAAPGASVSDRARVSALGADLLMTADDSAQAAPLYRTAVQLMPAVAWIGVDRTTQQSHLTHASAISRDSAACLLIVGDASQVVEQLEEGRGILWTQLLQRRHHDERLERRHPELAARLRDLATALDALSVGNPEG